MAQPDPKRKTTAFVRAPYGPEPSDSLRIIGIPAGLFWLGLAVLIVVLGVVLAIVM
jgi:hypothetical protein